MSCYFPLRAFKAKSKDPQIMSLTFRRSESFRGQDIKLPCGQCIGCRLERARQWAVRCMHEASLYDDNCFITLTYDQKNLPEDGSLHLDHFQLFMKRLRKEYGSGIRYFHCGEYGEKFERPHYHALLFNHDFKDRQYFSERNGNKVFTSDSLSRLWTKGFSVVGQVSFESASYVARYALKKVHGKGKEDHYKGRKEEYCTMSRRPGIGAKWFDKYSGEVFPRDGVVMRGHISRPPRFYDDMYGKRDPSGLALVKLKREYDMNKLDKFEFDSFRLPVKEEVKRAEISVLSRHKDGV